MSSNISLKANNISKCYHVYDQPLDRLKQYIMPALHRYRITPNSNYYREFWALKELSLEIAKGEAVGIIGRNGSGKSTLLQLICGTLTPTTGSIEVSGVISALLELGSGFNPEFTGRQNVFMNASLLGLTNRQITEKFNDIIEFADIGSFINEPIKSYSSGMMVRLAFAVAINIEPEILVIDEALAVGDAAFQRKCIRKIEELKNNGTTLLFVSHDIETIKRLCSRAIYLNKGDLIEFGEAKDVCISYEKDLFGGFNLANGNYDTINIKNTRENASLDPELIASSAQYYGDGKVSVSELTLSNRNNKAINVIGEDVNFRISYRVSFHEDIKNPIFGIMITNREGNCIFGVNTSKRQISRQNYSAGDEIKVIFDLNNNLGAGVFYVTCGVHSANSKGDVVYHQRCIDVIIFKIKSNETEQVSGLVNLNPQICYDLSKE
jgi:lipopolysaccharide transport system ATP-binding protein